MESGPPLQTPTQPPIKRRAVSRIRQGMQQIDASLPAGEGVYEARFADSMEEQGISPGMLPSMSSSELFSIGVNGLGHKRRLRHTSFVSLSFSSGGSLSLSSDGSLSSDSVGGQRFSGSLSEVTPHHTPFHTRQNNSASGASSQSSQLANNHSPPPLGASEEVDWKTIWNDLHFRLNEDLAVTTLGNMKKVKKLFQNAVEPTSSESESGTCTFSRDRADTIMHKLICYLQANLESGRYLVDTARCYLKAMASLYKYLGWSLSRQGEKVLKNMLVVLARQEQKDREGGLLSANIATSYGDVKHIINSLLMIHKGADSSKRTASVETRHIVNLRH